MAQDPGRAAAEGSGRPSLRAGGGRRIVAGVDGSPSSRAALAWAVRQGALTGAVVDAVIAWDCPARYSRAAFVVSDYEGMAGQVLADAITAVGSPAGVRPRVVRGQAARVLIEASTGADLLVVGSRGHGGFTGALLGSVGRHCLHHASCPVAVIRGKPATPGGTQPP